MKRVLLLIVLLLPSSAFGVATGIWSGDQTRDPITDKPTSLAIIYSDRGGASLALRCRNGVLDIFINPDRTIFKTGDRKEVTIRFDTATPINIPAIALEPNLLGLDHKLDNSLPAAFLRARMIVTRFTGEYGRSETFTFQSTLAPNSLFIVGRVLSDCGTMTLPQDEIDKEIKALNKALQDQNLQKRNRSK